MPLNWALNMSKMVNPVLYIFYHNKKKHSSVKDTWVLFSDLPSHSNVKLNVILYSPRVQFPYLSKGNKGLTVSSSFKMILLPIRRSKPINIWWRVHVSDHTAKDSLHLNLGELSQFFSWGLLGDSWASAGCS